MIYCFIPQPQTPKVPFIDYAPFDFISETNNSPTMSNLVHGLGDNAIQAEGDESIAFHKAFVKVFPVLHAYL